MIRNIPAVTKNLLLINILAFAASALILPGLKTIGGLHFFLASDFHLYQFVTYMFLHANFQHLFFNMFALWMFGCVMEQVWGSKKFLIYYMVCGIGAGLMQEAAQLINLSMTLQQTYPEISLLNLPKGLAMQLNYWTTIGASGSVYAILLAFGMTFPNERMFIFPLPIPIKAKWFVLLYIGIEVFSALTLPGDGVAHMAHLGGMLFGFIMIRYWQNHPGAYYNHNNGYGFFNNLKQNFEKMKQKKAEPQGNMHAGQGGRQESDWEYNARKKANQDEIDRILDKIRTSGYDSLTKEEKKKLFDSSKDYD